MRLEKQQQILTQQFDNDQKAHRRKKVLNKDACVAYRFFPLLIDHRTYRIECSVRVPVSERDLLYTYN